MGKCVGVFGEVTGGVGTCWGKVRKSALGGRGRCRACQEVLGEVCRSGEEVWGR